MAIGTSTVSNDLNSRNTLPAKSTPRPSEIHLARGAKAPDGGTSRSQANSMATPSTARTTEMVSASAPALSATLLSTSAQANEEAPSSAGLICASRLPACGVEDFVTMGVRCGERPQANAEARAARLFPGARSAHVDQRSAR